MFQSSSVEIKMVEGGKSLFKCKVHLNSTIYTKDQHLHNFFFNCQKMFGSPSPSMGADTDNLNKLKVCCHGNSDMDRIREGDSKMNSV